MRRLRDFSLRSRLLWTSALASAVALVLAGTSIVAYDLHLFRENLVRRLSIGADMVASSSLSAILFEDKDAAERALAALRADAHVQVAAIYRPDHTLFASYARGAITPAAALPSPPAGSSHVFDRGEVALFHPVVFDGSPVATVYLRRDLDELRDRLTRYALIVGIVLVLSLAISLPISTLLHRSIAHPIQELAATARAVAARKDYSLRAEAGGGDEIGALIDTLNEMLAEIQGHEAKLEEARGTLEIRVQERTRELQAELEERKRAEEEIQRLGLELEKRFVELTSVNRELEAFSYSVSHDLRAPLRHISGFVDLLRRRCHDALDETGRRYLDVIATSARRMGQLIDDLLAFSRMGRAEILRGKVALEPLVREVIEQLRAENPAREVVFRTNGLPTVMGDPAMLRIVVTNLLSNAVKYTRTRPRAEVEIGSRKGPDGQVEVFVRDNGVGFDMQYADKLFGVFQRLHGADEFEGTGIGLATVRRIIHRHGGHTWAEAAPGQGATFSFSLPASTEA